MILYGHLSVNDQVLEDNRRRVRIGEFSMREMVFDAQFTRPAMVGFMASS